MNRPTRFAAISLMIASLLFAVSCSEEDGTVTPAPLGTVTFNVDNNVDGVPVNYNQLLYTNARGTLYSISKLEYLISDVLLHTTSGEIYGMDGVHFRDEADAGTRSFSIGDVPAGTYNMISFTFGLDQFKNVRDLYLNEPWHGEMQWPGPMGYDQGLGYHYMKIEGNFEDTPGGSTSGYTTHTGARMCNGPCGPAGTVVDPVPIHHFFRVSLPVAPTAIDGNHWTVTISVNVNGWYQDHTPLDGLDTEYDWHDLGAQMIMANTAAQDVLETNGPGCFSASISASQ